MNVSQLKSVLLEVITESMFGRRFKISIDGKTYPALISSNVAHDVRREAEYRITWFEPASMEPIRHIAFGSETLNYILRYNKFPLGMSLQYFKLGLPTPKIIVEVVKVRSPKTTADILVGTIDPDDNHVEAKFGGTHQSLSSRNNRRADFRFNDETKIVYWHEEHPSIYEELVEDYILYKIGSEVKKHITLDRYRDNHTAYTLYWNDAHGLDQPEPTFKL